MNRTLPKLVISIVMLANINPVFAGSKLPSNEVSKQMIDHKGTSQTTMIAGFFDVIQDANETFKDVNDTIETMEEREIEQEEREQRIREQELRQQERQQSLEERKRQQALLEEARRVATEQEKLEAQRRREHYDSLSPEEKQSYIEEQRELKEKQKQTTAILFLGMLGLMFGDSSAMSDEEARQRDEQEWLIQQQRQRDMERQRRRLERQRRRQRPRY